MSCSEAILSRNKLFSFIGRLTSRLVSKSSMSSSSGKYMLDVGRDFRTKSPCFRFRRLSFSLVLRLDMPSATMGSFFEKVESVCNDKFGVTCLFCRLICSDLVFCIFPLRLLFVISRFLSLSVSREVFTLQVSQVRGSNVTKS